jgi:hypothetical protein
MFFAAVLGVVLALRHPSRPLAMVIGWCAVFYAWLSFGFDPLSGSFRLKPQLSRYLQDFSIPLAVLVGWTMLHIWRRAPRWASATGAVAACGLALVCIIFNALGYQAPRATRHALDEAVAHNWFPLYTDVQSIAIADFVLHDTVHRADVHPAQTHNFLTGQTSFATIPDSSAYVLINDGFGARLRQRNLVTPIDPTKYGLKATLLANVGASLPLGAPLILAPLDILEAALPAAMGSKIAHLTDDARNPSVVRIYALDK